MKDILEDKKVIRVLEFLATEKWATRQVIHELIEHDYYAATTRLIDRMKKEGLLTSDLIRETKGRGVYVLFITNYGFSLVSDFESIQNFRPLSLSRIAMNSYNHNVDLQRLHACCIKKGFTDYSKPDYAYREKSVHYADASATLKKEHYSFEVERSVKTVLRYQNILGHYAAEIKKGSLHKIIYLSPSSSITKRLMYIFDKIETIIVDGETFAKPANLLDRFEFLTYNDFGF